MRRHSIHSFLVRLIKMERVLPFGVEGEAARATYAAWSN